MDQQARFKVAVDSELSEVIQQLGKVASAHEALTAQVGQGNAKIDNAYRSQSLAIGKLTTEITKQADAERKAQAERDKAAAQHEKSLKQIGSQYDYLGNQVASFKNYLLGAFAVDQILNYGQKILDAAGNMQQFQISLEVMLQSKSKADKLMAEVIEFTKKTPFTLEQTQEATTKLLAYGLASEDVIRTLNSLGNIAAAVGTDKLPQLILAFGQVKAAGHLTGAELRQFTEAGVNMFEALSATTGKSVAQIQKDISKGVISFADVQKAIFSLGEEGGRFANLMVKQSDTITGKLSNLGDSMYQFFAKLGTSRSGLIYGVTEALTDFFEWLGNSSRNMEIAMDVVKAGVSGWVAYKTILETVIKTKALLALEAKATATAMATNTVATAAGTAATSGMTVATNTLWTAMRANPLGFVIGLISSIYSAYQLWTAASLNMQEEIGHEQLALETQRVKMNELLKVATANEEGTARRTQAIRTMVAEYPEYFAGIDTEKMGNAQLRGIIDQLNISLSNRIALARESYRLNSLQEERNKLFQQEADLMERIKDKSPELYDQVGGSVEKLVEKMKTMNKEQYFSIANAQTLGQWWDSVANGSITESAKTIDKRMKEIDKSMVESSISANNLKEGEKVWAIQMENSKHAGILKELDKGSKEYRAEVERHNEAIGDLEGKAISKSVAALGDGEGKKKTIQKSSLELSLENQQKELKAQEQTLGVKLKLLDVEEDLKIEQTKRQIKNVEAREERILSIEQQYESKRQKLLYDSMHDALEKEIKEHETAKIKIVATRSDMTESFIKEYKVYASEVKKLEEEIEKIIVDNAGKESDRKAAEYVEQAVAHKKFWQNRKDVEEAATYEINSQRINGWYEERRNLMEQTEILKGSTGEKYLTYLQYVKRINELNGLITSGEEEEAEKRIQITKALKDREIAIFQTVFSIIRAGWVVDIQPTLNALDALEKASSRFYDMAMEDSKSRMEAEIANGEKTVDELLGIWDKYGKEQSQILNSKDRVAEMSFYFKGMAQVHADTVSEMAKATEQISSGTVIGIVSGIATALNALVTAKQRAKILAMEMEAFQQERAINTLNQEKQLLEDRYQAAKESMQKELDDYTDTKNKEIDAATKAKDENVRFLENLRDSKIDLLNQQMDAVNDYYDNEIAKAQQAFDTKQALDNQAAEDGKRLLEASDRFRNDTLDAWEVRQVRQLEQERNRNLARAQSDEEYQQITNFYAAEIESVHKTKQDAMLDKSLSVKLGMEELSDQLKDTSVKNKEDEQKAIDKINDDRLTAETKLKNDIVDLKAEYGAKIDQIESDLAAQIKQLKDEIAAKDAEMNTKMTDASAAHDAALRAMNRGIFEAERQFAAMQIQVEIAKMFASKNPNFKMMTQLAMYRDEIMGWPNPYFKGTDWLERNGEPAGRDTIHIRANEGERIIPTEDNKRLGGRKLSNRDLVDGYLGYAQLREKFPSMFNLSMPSSAMKLNSLVGLPSVGGAYDPRLLGEVQRLNSTMQRLESKPGVIVNATKTGISILEKRANSLNKIYTTRYRT